MAAVRDPVASEPAAGASPTATPQPVILDPRPDLAARYGDGGAWAALLAAQFRADGHDPAGLFATLHGVRCLGAVLVAHRAGGRYALRPSAEYRGGPDAWAADRATHLVPHTAALVAALDAIPSKDR